MASARASPSRPAVSSAIGPDTAGGVHSGPGEDDADGDAAAEGEAPGVPAAGAALAAAEGVGWAAIEGAGLVAADDGDWAQAIAGRAAVRSVATTATNRVRPWGTVTRTSSRVDPVESG